MAERPRNRPAAVLAAAAAIATAVISARSNAADTHPADRSPNRGRESGSDRGSTGAGQGASNRRGVPAGNIAHPAADPIRPEEQRGSRPITIQAIAAAPELGVDRWQRVAAALSTLDSLGFYVTDKYRRGGRRLDRGDVAVFELDIATIDGAWEALAPLSGTPKIRVDPLGPE